MALLSAVKAGIFAVQAAGNTGPSPKSMSSFSPWIFTVGAASHDRAYSNSIILGNNVTIHGVGLARKFIITAPFLNFSAQAISDELATNKIRAESTTTINVIICFVMNGFLLFIEIESNNIHCFPSAGTHKNTMLTLISALHALDNETTVATDMYVGECQDSSNFNRDLVKGNLLICSYSIRFVLGLSTIKQAIATAKNLSAAGVVFYMDPFVIGFQLNPIPMRVPGIIIPSPDDSKVKVICVSIC